MNGQEQRERHTAMAILEGKFKELKETVEAAYEQELQDRTKGDFDMGTLLVQTVGGERDARLDLAKQQRTYVDNELFHTNRQIRFMREAPDNLLQLGFWGRLRWVLTGRVR